MSEIETTLVLPEETPDQWETRRQFREELLDDLLFSFGKAAVTIEGGSLDGTAVVSAGRFAEIIEEARGERLPPVSVHAAEVVTDASVTVWAVCPRCRIAAPILLTIEPELRVDTSGAELRLRAKAKPRTHVCGQLPLPVEPNGGLFDAIEAAVNADDDDEGDEP